MGERRFVRVIEIDDGVYLHWLVVGCWNGYSVVHIRTAQWQGDHSRGRS